MFSSSSIRIRILQDPSYGIALKTNWGMQKDRSDLNALSKGGFENTRASSFAGSKIVPAKEVMEKKQPQMRTPSNSTVEIKLCLCIRTNQKL